MGDIPNPVKRQLRQEAGFGCCFCGFPIIQYHHIIPRAVEDHNRPEDMMVVCPNDHDAITKGALSAKEQRTAKGNPLNVRRGFVEGLLKLNQRYCALSTGSFQFVNDGLAVVVDGEPLLRLGFEGDRLLVSATIYDEADQLLALIDENEWIAGDPAPWDLEADHQVLRVRRGARDVRLDLDARHQPMRLRATLLKSRRKIVLSKRGVAIDGTVGKIGIEELCFVGMYIDVHSRERSVRLVPDPRYGSGFIVSDENRMRRLVKGINALSRLQGKSPSEATFG